MIKNKVRLYHCTYNTAVKIIKKEMATIDPLTYTYIYDATKKIKEAKKTQKMPYMEKDANYIGKWVTLNLTGEN